MRKLNDKLYLLDTAEGAVALHLESLYSWKADESDGGDLDQLILRVESASSGLIEQAREHPRWVFEEVREEIERGESSLNDWGGMDVLHFGRVKANGEVDLGRLTDGECNPVIAMFLTPSSTGNHDFYIYVSDPFMQVWDTHYSTDGDPEDWKSSCTEGWYPLDDELTNFREMLPPNHVLRTEISRRASKAKP